MLAEGKFALPMTEKQYRMPTTGIRRRSIFRKAALASVLLRVCSDISSSLGSLTTPSFNPADAPRAGSPRVSIAMVLAWLRRWVSGSSSRVEY